MRVDAEIVELCVGHYLTSFLPTVASPGRPPRQHRRRCATAQANLQLCWRPPGRAAARPLDPRDQFWHPSTTPPPRIRRVGLKALTRLTAPATRAWAAPSTSSRARASPACAASATILAVTVSGWPAAISAEGGTGRWSGRDRLLRSLGRWPSRWRGPPGNPDCRSGRSDRAGRRSCGRTRPRYCCPPLSIRPPLTTPPPIPVPNEEAHQVVASLARRRTATRPRRRRARRW